MEKDLSPSRACKQEGGWQGRRLARPLASIKNNTSTTHICTRIAHLGMGKTKDFLVFLKPQARAETLDLRGLPEGRLFPLPAEGVAASANGKPFNTGLDRIHQSGLAIQ